MEKANTVAIVILLAIAVGVVFLIATDEGPSVEVQVNVAEDAVEITPSQTAPVAPQANPIATETNPVAPQPAAVSAPSRGGTYATYSNDAEVVAAAEGGPTVLFFAASWCPTCRSLDRSLREDLSSIPSDLTIFSVDYDRYDNLKRKYNVRYQHTLVQVDENLAPVNTWTGSRNILDINAEVVR